MGGLPTVGNFLVFLSLNKACLVNDLSVALKIALREHIRDFWASHSMWCSSGKLVSHVQP